MKQWPHLNGALQTVPSVRVENQNNDQSLVVMVTVHEKVDRRICSCSLI